MRLRRPEWPYQPEIRRLTCGLAANVLRDDRYGPRAVGVRTAAVVALDIAPYLQPRQSAARAPRPPVHALTVVGCEILNESDRIQSFQRTA